MRNKIICLSLVFLLPAAAFPEDIAQPSKKPFAQTPDKNSHDQVYGDYSYTRPTLTTFLKKAPGDVVDVGKETFRKENTPWIVLMVAGTGVLIVADQYILEKSQNLGDHLGISHTAYQKTFVRINVPIVSKDFNVEGPFDSGSALYFLGDGWTDVVIAGSFLGYGLVKSNNRAIQTSSQIAESILASGAVVQVLKHATGRESPFTTNTPRGNWRFFPNQIEYAKHVPSYDAFPSGHLAAAMAVVTVSAENYPEYKFIRPVGYSLMTVLGFQMLNNGVHWVSDYPLGIWLGYAFGKMAVRKGRIARAQSAKNQWEFSPALVSDGIGVEARLWLPAGKKKDE